MYAEVAGHLLMICHWQGSQKGHEPNGLFVGKFISVWIGCCVVINVIWYYCYYCFEILLIKKIILYFSRPLALDYSPACLREIMRRHLLHFTRQWMGSLWPLLHVSIFYSVVLEVNIKLFLKKTHTNYWNVPEVWNFSAVMFILIF